MAFQQALSGLNTAAKAIDSTSHNIANSSTVGYKSSTAHFSDVYAASLTGAGSSQVGIGVNLSAVQQQFTQGNITATNNPLDISINGGGFFRMDQNGATTFARNGQFHLDKNGFIINDQGMRLTGYIAQAGIITPTTPGPLQISASDLAPVATGENDSAAFRGVKANLQLDSRSTTPAVPWSDAAAPTGASVSTNVTGNGGTAGQAAAAAAAFDAAIGAGSTQAAAAQAAFDAVIAAGGSVLVATAARTAGLSGANFTPDPQSYNYSTALSVFDSLGNEHTLTMFFEKTSASGAWDVNFTVDGTSNQYVSVTPANTLQFNTLGQISGGNPMSLQIDLNNVMGALGTTNDANPVMSFDVDFTGTTQFGSSFGTNRLEQDGYTAGNLIGLSVGNDGVIQGRYSNGQTFAQGQVVLANFTNPNGLQSLGNNQWSETSASGPALVGAPGTSSLGVLSSGTVEESNVDLTAELVSLITQQRNYQANAQSIKTQDQVLQTLVNLR
ncbi:MAG: flagellar hook protein FlgE [Betaproteobacteria bacterium HGW-Betaproteobacteria-12]|nr:MAG: flagellar hook protein FlgE [Betaproteobacteria bacterium HGW-Betaproteobacteria-12]